MLIPFVPQPEACWPELQAVRLPRPPGRGCIAAIWVAAWCHADRNQGDTDDQEIEIPSKSVREGFTLALAFLVASAAVASAALGSPAVTIHPSPVRAAAAARRASVERVAARGLTPARWLPVAVARCDIYTLLSLHFLVWGPFFALLLPAAAATASFLRICFEE